jgi:hypothetical protein
MLLELSYFDDARVPDNSTRRQSTSRPAMEKGVVKEAGVRPRFCISAGDGLAVRASVALTDRLGNRHRVIDDPTDAGCRPDGTVHSGPE